VKTAHGLRETEALDGLGQKWSDADLKAAQVRICEPEEAAAAALFLASEELHQRCRSLRGQRMVRKGLRGATCVKLPEKGGLHGRETDGCRRQADCGIRL
jgi:NAD(P)-dependent dehydrogenase (short-subunit alcohol dehydrogenase family)